MKHAATVLSKNEKNLQLFSRHERSLDPPVTQNTDLHQMWSDVYACVGRRAGNMRFVTEEITLLSINKNEKKWKKIQQRFPK